MQPYFLPYIGYFQLVAAADLFIVYDDVEYTKKGWINRNRILRDGADTMITLPLKKDSDFLDVVDRRLADDFRPRKMLAQIEGAYRKAPHYGVTRDLLDDVFSCEDRNLFGFIHHSITRVCAHLGIETPIRVSSSFGLDRGLKGAERVLALCAAAGADAYVNPIGGVDLYSKSAFAARGVDLSFLRARRIEYAQFGAPFVPFLSIVDVMMFNSLDTISTMLRTGWDRE